VEGLIVRDTFSYFGCEKEDVMGAREYCRHLRIEYTEDQMKVQLG